MTRYLPVAEVKRLMAEAGFSNAFAEPAEQIQKTFTGEAVFQDPFLVRQNTSQLLLISEDVYLKGKRAITSAVQKAKRQERSILFRVDLTLFVTVGEANSPTLGLR